MAKTKIEQLHDKLIAVQSTYLELKKAGVNPELLQIYLAHKCGLSMKKAKQVLERTEEFYNNLVVNDVLQKL